VETAAGLMQAVRIILVADLIMSTDNVLAVAGASKGNMFLLLFGLGTSIPLVVGTSTLLAMLMEKYPIIITLGSAILGKVAGEMIITDPWIHKTFLPSHATEIGFEIFFAVGVIVLGKYLLRRKAARAPELVPVPEEVPAGKPE
jgi:predicted tellurium resistance membrane protein TerC